MDAPARTTILRDAISGVLRIAAFALAISLTLAAWHDVSKAWDAWYYHLPFAGRIVGLVDPSAYAFAKANVARFEGFPLAAEALQGLLWRITGRLEAANFVALAALPLLAAYLRRFHAVPPYLTLLALLAIPLVQIHATATYVDLPANACVTVLLLCAYRAVVSRDPPTPRLLAWSGVVAALAANMKFQLVPVVIAAAVVLTIRSLALGGRRRARLLVIAIALPVVFATPLKNVALHGNPVWPIDFHLAGKSLPHVERAYASSPAWLETAPRPVRFVCSALEIGARPIASQRRWSLDQWTPPSEPGYRMGGFFGAYVIANLAALAFAAFRRRTRESLTALGFALGAGALASVLPQSHELRYYLFSILFLVSLNLAMWAREAPIATGLVAAVALMVVVWSTGATYIYPSGDSFAELMRSKLDARALESIAPGERICIRRAPWTFLYAPTFHPEKRYSVQEAEDEADCAGARTLE